MLLDGEQRVAAESLAVRQDGVVNEQVVVELVFVGVRARIRLRFVRQAGRRR